MAGTIKRVLVTVSDKSDLDILARVFLELKCEVISTGKTSETLNQLGVKTTDIQNLTGKPEAFGGRMKTLSYEVFSAILFDRNRDAEEAHALQIKPIDLVVCNLYPFKEKVSQLSNSPRELVEFIDVGGPSLLRAAAKNHDSVTVLCDPADYPAFAAEVAKQSGSTSVAFRFSMARKAFNHTADYDAAIASQFDSWAGTPSLRLGYTLSQPLRYGENPHQKAGFYTPNHYEHKGVWSRYTVLGGKELSYNNLLDLDAAWQAVSDLGPQGCVVVKHGSPCGMAQCVQQDQALRWAWASDPVSAFGSVIAFNTPVTLETLKFFNFSDADRLKRRFVEALMAPGFSDEAVAYAREQKNVRIVAVNETTVNGGQGAAQALRMAPPQQLRFLNGGLLVQDADTQLFGDELLGATDVPQPPWLSPALLAFGTKVVREVKSNAIAVVAQWHDCYLVLGLGGGQPNRLSALKLALERTDDFCKRESSILKQNIRDTAVVFSDAFFPFADNVHLCSLHGIKTVVQPGGSVQDPQVIQAAKNHSMCMLLTKTRHFKH